MIVTIYIKWAKHFKHIMQLILNNKNPGNRPTFIFKCQSVWSKQPKTRNATTRHIKGKSLMEAPQATLVAPFCLSPSDALFTSTSGADFMTESLAKHVVFTNSLPVSCWSVTNDSTTVS